MVEVNTQSRIYTRGQDVNWRADCVTTPPIPSSSPGPLDERMDISPLPHKQPYNAMIEIQSPTPGHTPDAMVETPEEDVMPSSPPRLAVDAPRPTNATE
jgi:M-phase inducer tyrosine phosphatase